MKKSHEYFMKRCLELAQKSLGLTAPNPMVGSVIVYKNKIIGEGYTSPYGESHAEVNAIKGVKDQSILSESTLYVNLEPCNHQGKTPPCSDFIVRHGIKNVVIACTDSNSLVNGSGIKKLRSAGVNVTLGILEGEAKNLNRRFFTFHEKKRPYIILKWAETKDGFIDKIRNEGKKGQFEISNKACKVLSHQWRSQEQAILVGTNTALNDNPQLTNRNNKNSNPIRLLIDRELKVPQTYHLFDQESKTLIFNELSSSEDGMNDFVQLNFEIDVIPQILEQAYQKNIQSIIIEGGKLTLESFISSRLWDEARVFIGSIEIGDGLKSPIIEGPFKEQQIENNFLKTYYINSSIFPFR